MDNFSNSLEGIQEKGKHSFPYLHSMKSELNSCMNCCVKLYLCGAEDVRVAKEGKTPCTLSLKDEVATRELPPKGSCRDIITLS